MGIRCWLTRRRLDAFRDGELEPKVRASTAAHLTRCAACAAELAALERLRTALLVEAPEPPAAVWDTFWPQVRTRIATSVPEPEPRRLWRPVLTYPRLAFGSALAATALVVLAVLAPWQRAPETPQLPVVGGGSGTMPAPAESPTSGAQPTVVVQSVETADPQSSVMVYTNQESDMTVVWVFGLEPTDI
jgi:anti-sigma factor RsiW